MSNTNLLNPTSIAQQPSLTAPNYNQGLISSNPLGPPTELTPGRAVAPPPSTGTFQRMSDARADADQRLGTSTTTGACATCPFPIRLEHRSRYTEMRKYSPTDWVAARDFIFLIGQDRVLSVRVAEPQGASATWEITPIGRHSGTINPNRGTGSRFDYTPRVTRQQRPIEGSRAPNPAVKYQIKARVTHQGQTHEITETVEQDERDIIRQEFVDYRTWEVDRRGRRFTVHVPYRTHIKAASRPALRGNYTLVLDSAMTELLVAVEGQFDGTIVINSGWRNPQRNKIVGGVIASKHLYGRAIDIKPANLGSGAAGRRAAFLELYNAALRAGGRVLLEHMGTQLYPTSGAIPAPSAAQPDDNDDGIPDTAVSAKPGTGESRRIEGWFDYATHIHTDRLPLDDEAEDD